LKGYSTSEVAKLLGLSASQVRGYVRAGFLSPERGSRGELSFSFQDLVFLRTARGLMSERVSARIRSLPGAEVAWGVAIVVRGTETGPRSPNAPWTPDVASFWVAGKVADSTTAPGGGAGSANDTTSLIGLSPIESPAYTVGTAHCIPCALAFQYIRRAPEPDCGGDPRCKTHRGGAYNMTSTKECRTL
jgi:hypothetical protein